ncbi:hypothetical protein CEXT_109161 [Caerostris extrusa]|uniref:Uncharacterized protein n=1 Tax=Caerostris extrusa TaxID=172846 RepID=A0AAV4UHA9_CAEEX|nr:hypothetical protein CEXT_109161 [Caerostris extrusa]
MGMIHFFLVFGTVYAMDFAIMFVVEGAALSTRHPMKLKTAERTRGKNSPVWFVKNLRFRAIEMFLSVNKQIPYSNPIAWHSLSERYLLIHVDMQIVGFDMNCSLSEGIQYHSKLGLTQVRRSLRTEVTTDLTKVRRSLRTEVTTDLTQVRRSLRTEVTTDLTQVRRSLRTEVTTDLTQVRRSLRTEVTTDLTQVRRSLRTEVTTDLTQVRRSLRAEVTTDLTQVRRSLRTEVTTDLTQVRRSLRTEVTTDLTQVRRSRRTEVTTGLTKQVAKVFTVQSCFYRKPL